MPNFLYTFNDTGPGVRADMGVDDGAITYVAAGALMASTSAEAINGGGNRQRVTVLGEVASFIGPFQSFMTGAIIMTGTNPLVYIACTGVARNMATDFSPAVVLSGANAQLNDAGQIHSRVGDDDEFRADFRRGASGIRWRGRHTSGDQFAQHAGGCVPQS